MKNMRDELSLKPKQALFILLFSWIVTFLAYYFPWDSMSRSVFEIYNIIGVPSAVLLGYLKTIKRQKL